MQVLTSSTPRHICSAPSIWRRIWSTTCATNVAVALTSCRWKTCDMRCIVTETTLSLLILQRSLCRMLCGRWKVRRTRTQLSESSWHIQSGETNSDGNVEQRCADSASDAKHCQKAGPKKALYEPGSNNSSISVTTGPSRGYHFFKNKITLLQ